MVGGHAFLATGALRAVLPPNGGFNSFPSKILQALVVWRPQASAARFKCNFETSCEEKRTMATFSGFWEHGLSGGARGGDKNTAHQQEDRFMRTSIKALSPHQSNAVSSYAGHLTIYLAWLSHPVTLVVVFVFPAIFPLLQSVVGLVLAKHGVRSFPDKKSEPPFSSTWPQITRCLHRPGTIDAPGWTAQPSIVQHLYAVLTQMS